MKPKASANPKPATKPKPAAKPAIDIGAVIGQLLDGDEAARADASAKLEKAARKDPTVAEQVVAACDRRPDTTDADVVMVRFAELAINDDTLVTDKRTLALLRRQLEVKPAGVSADELSAQEMAVATLVSIKDRASLPAIVGLLAQESRESLWFNICDAVNTLGGGAAELAALEVTLPHANDSEAFELEKLIKKLAKRLR